MNIETIAPEMKGSVFDKLHYKNVRTIFSTKALDGSHHPFTESN